MRVVREAVMLFLGIVQHQAELHPLARLLAVGQAAHAGQNGDDAGILVLGHGKPGGAALGPVRRHPVEVRNQQVGRGLLVLRAPVAMAVRAGVACRIIRSRAARLRPPPGR